ncbi:hypothetical protein B0H17DRAFT_256299 [Mycena rosella]|uniref:Uncharacterized protein n=1 Tax=Mycena rosella TaxID=1033263 RepID=A0AAD7CW95_MYCRO|nr:hypothetical protein B0H17DRAFT_256299 [Mycena rosella]
MIIASLSLTEYHARVNLYTVHRLSLRAHTRIGPGAIVLTSSPRPVEIAYIPECDISDTGWRLSSGAPLASVLMLNGWTRLDAADSTAGLSRRIKYCGPRHCWLAQANYMFSQVETESREDEYVFVDEVAYYLQLAKPSARPSPGYLFLCPFQDLQHASTAAYWSCDPSGIERRGPALKLIVKAWGHSWDAFLYAGLQQFHRGKGFDPRSQDVARHLGFPLYRLSPRAVVGKEDVSKNEKQTPDVQGARL